MIVLGSRLILGSRLFLIWETRDAVSIKVDVSNRNEVGVPAETKSKMSRAKTCLMVQKTGKLSHGEDQVRPIAS